MAKKVSIELTDDIDPTHTATETVEFGIDGITYNIDLSEENATKLRDTIRPWIESARQVTRTPRKRLTADPEIAAIRAWAKEQGIPIPPRGRIAKDIVAAYHNRGKDKVAAAIQRQEAKITRQEKENQE